MVCQGHTILNFKATIRRNETRELGGKDRYLYLCPQKPGGIVLKKFHPREEFLKHEVQLPRILFKTLHAPKELKAFLKF